MRERGRVLVALAAAVILVGGGVWWWAARDTAPAAVQVPERVCGGTLPGKAAAALLPKEGDAFREKLDLHFTLPSNRWCSLTSGGTYLDLNYWREPSDSYADEMADDPKKPGNTPIQLGEAAGYTSEQAATLYVSCPSESGRQEHVKVRAALQNQAEARSREPDTDFAELIGDATRHVAKELDCEGAAKLPSEVPTAD
ncbi:hypothetical protein [Streptomyces sp. NPDC020681]|uniref:hypothetical protein n=1 Tax=Streptomyces sp. NPDC020681 TaxID=3365083 RepID=UPI0037926D9F